MQEFETPTQQITPKKASKQRIVISVLVLLLVLALALAFAMFLRQRVANKVADKPVAAKTADEAYAAYTAEGKIASLKAPDFTLSAQTNAPIFYKDASVGYYTTVPASKSGQYTSKPGVAKVWDKLVSEGTSLMSGLGLSQVASPAPSTDTNRFTAYQNDLTYCELSSYPSIKDKDPIDIYTMSCVDKKAASAKVKNIADMLAQAKVKTDGMKSIMQTTESNKDASYTMIYANTGSTNSMLLFTTAGGATEFIGDLGSGDKQYFDGRYYITPEVKAKLTDPKYGNLLKNAILGTTS